MKPETMERILVFWFFSFIISSLILVGYYDIPKSHETLGVYSLVIEDACGKDVTGCLAVWYQGYLNVEHDFLRDGLLIGLGIGLAMGAFPPLILYYRKGKKGK